MSRENLPRSGTRGGRQAAAGVSVSTSLSVIVAAIAVLLGFLILRDINRDRPVGDAVGGGGAGVTEDSITDDTGSASSVITLPVDRTGFKVIVANSSGVQGAAGQMTTALQAQQFVVSSPVNADDALGTLSTTVVYYVPGFEGQATLVADVLGGVQIQPIPNPAPIENGGSIGEAVVLVMLGTDLAGKLLPGALPETPVGTTTTSSTSVPAG